MNAVTLDGDTVRKVGEITRVIAALDQPLAAVLSLWSDINTWGSDSLYLARFDNPTVAEIRDDPGAFDLQLATYDRAHPLSKPPRGYGELQHAGDALSAHLPASSPRSRSAPPTWTRSGHTRRAPTSAQSPRRPMRCSRFTTSPCCSATPSSRERARAADPRPHHAAGAQRRDAVPGSSLDARIHRARQRRHGIGPVDRDARLRLPSHGRAGARSGALRQRGRRVARQGVERAARRSSGHRDHRRSGWDAARDPARRDPIRRQSWRRSSTSSNPANCRRRSARSSWRAT